VNEARLQPCADADELALRAAELVVETAHKVLSLREPFTFAVSGGRTPWAMFAQLRTLDFPWALTHIYQVDERVAPVGDPARNLTHLHDSVPHDAHVHAMPVNDPDLTAAAHGYAATLPGRFDLIHLGLGPDGHTASLVPGDAALDAADIDVAVTAPYQGHPRMTLTFPVLNRAHQVLWLVSGADKVAALARLLAHDQTIPAGRVTATQQTVVADRSALGN
jgi:6-phosphogluconolactonase